MLMMSDSLSAADVVAIEKVRGFRRSIHRLTGVGRPTVSVLYDERLVVNRACIVLST